MEKLFFFALVRCGCVCLATECVCRVLRIFHLFSSGIQRNWFLCVREIPELGVHVCVQQKTNNNSSQWDCDESWQFLGSGIFFFALVRFSEILCNLLDLRDSANKLVGPFINWQMMIFAIFTVNKSLAQKHLKRCEYEWTRDDDYLNIYYVLECFSIKL